jgi:hypothetical protein
MAKNEQKVMQWVEKQLEANPDITTSELHEKAKKVDSGVAQLSLRQFNARFPLQVKRKKSLATGGGRRKRKSTRSRRHSANLNRDAVRNVLLQFASDLSAAEERKDVVQVVARVDRYVDQVLKAAGKK